jgi:hypothetical protein
MSKRTKPTTTPSSSADAKLEVAPEILELLKSGKTDMVLTWKEFEKGKEPKTLELITAQEDEPLLVKVKHVDIVGFGYLPKGYPSTFKADRKMTRFIVVPADQVDDEPAQDTDANTEKA